MTQAQIDEVMRLASVMATRRVRAFAVSQASYRGNESLVRCEILVAEAKAALLKALHDASPS
jgi:hypothetical protein